MSGRPLPRRSRAGLRRALPLLLLAALPSCWTAALRRIPDSRSPYDVLPASALRRLARARADLARADVEGGRAEAARSALAALFTEHPRNIAVGVWLQEAEIAAAAEEAARPGTPVSAPETLGPQEAHGTQLLRQRYRERAEVDPTVANLVLAARLESDPLAAEVLLDRAETLDPDCAWCPYGLAWLAARAGDWTEVRERLARAKLADPAHMPTLWLDTWMLARSGKVPQAITSLDTWIEKAREDPRVDRRLVVGAQIDRALLAVLDGDPKEAKELLEELEHEPIERSRPYLIEAGAEQALGDAEAALAAARKAEGTGEGGILPAVQQALLHETWLGDPRAAEADWSRALKLASSDPALSSLLERLRARVRLERSAAARARETPGDPARARRSEERPQAQPVPVGDEKAR